MTRASILKAIRLTHHYSGVFLAPAILFFAITGGLQMFGLHETSRGSSYVPPAWLVPLSQLHKKGTIYLPPRRPQPAPQAAAAGKVEAPKPQPSAPSQPPHNPLPMKIFFGITALGLVVSTLTGLYMAWQYTRRKGLVAAVFVAGIVIPIGLLFV
jgi:hypothetical protein